MVGEPAFETPGALKFDSQTALQDRGSSTAVPVQSRDDRRPDRRSASGKLCDRPRLHGRTGLFGARRDRLARRGWRLGVVGAAVATMKETSALALPISVASRTVSAMIGRTALSGTTMRASLNAISLAQGVVRAMFFMEMRSLADPSSQFRCSRIIQKSESASRVPHPRSRLERFPASCRRVRRGRALGAGRSG